MQADAFVHSMRREAEALIERALEEDACAHDTTSHYILSAQGNRHAKMVLISNQAAVIAGLTLLPLMFPSPYRCSCHVRDGTALEKQCRLADIEGDAAMLLARERLCLNMIQILSGIASLTSRYQQQLRKTKTRLRDTRKTIPGMRYLSKYATRIGGADNHRFNLENTLFIKDNHIDISGKSLAAVLQYLKNHVPPYLWQQMIVECDTLAQVDCALSYDVPYILLDNMAPPQVTRAVTMINKRAITEASGNITLDNIKEFAACGVDYISVSAMTLSAPAIDIRAEWVIA